MWSVPGEIYAAKVVVVFKVRLLKDMNGFSHETGFILSKTGCSVYSYSPLADALSPCDTRLQHDAAT